MLTWSTFRTELRPTLRLAMPLALAEIGWMSMAIVDTMMVGRLPDSAISIAAVSIASSIFHALAFFGEGMLLGLDTLISQSFGAGDRQDCHRSLLNGIYLSLFIAPFLAAPILFYKHILRAIHTDPQVAALSVPYMYSMALGLLPLLLYFAVRRSMQAMNIVRPVAFALVTANLINLLGNYALVYGKLGFPRMGVTGSGIATCISRTYIASFLVIYLLWYDRRHRTQLLKTPAQPDLPRLRRLLALGFPSAIQVALEGGVFVYATAIISSLGAVTLASHQIALTTVALTYMVPLGISAAAAVRVGQAIGRKDPVGASNAGNTAIAVGAAFMSCTSILLLVFPHYIARLYTPDETVIRSTIWFLAAGAAFQLFDGIQTVATGALRGTGDTRTPMLCHFSGYWLIGVPVGLYLCFTRHWGAIGIWVGLSLGLIIIGILLLLVWRRKVRLLQLNPALALTTN
jgi:MATE family multidrug resistance protein